MRNLYRIPALAAGLSLALAACGGSHDDGPPPPPVLVDADSVRIEAGVSGDTFFAATKAVAALTDEVSSQTHRCGHAGRRNARTGALV
jgi:hypothetical protein